MASSLSPKDVQAAPCAIFPKEETGEDHNQETPPRLLKDDFVWFQGSIFLKINWQPICTSTTEYDWPTKSGQCWNPWRRPPHPPSSSSNWKILTSSRFLTTPLMWCTLFIQGIKSLTFTRICSRPFGERVFMWFHSTHRPYGLPSQATFIIHTILSPRRIGSSSSSSLDHHQRSLL